MLAFGTNWFVNGVWGVKKVAAPARQNRVVQALGTDHYKSRRSPRVCHCSE